MLTKLRNIFVIFLACAGSALYVMPTNINAAPNSTPQARIVNIADLSTGGSIGTAATTVNIADTIVLAQTTANQSIIIPPPTATANVRNIQIVKTATGAPVNVLGTVLGLSQAITVTWSGSAATSWTVFPTKINLAKVRASGASKIGSGNNPITWLSVPENVGGGFNSSSGVFTAPRTASYQVNFQVMFSSITGGAGNRAGIIIAKNGTGATFGIGRPIHSVFLSVVNPVNIAIRGSETVSLLVGQPMNLYFFLDTTSGGNTSNNNAFDFLDITEIPPAY